MVHVWYWPFLGGETPTPPTPPVNCDPETLLADASAFLALNEKQSDLVTLYLLCQWADSMS